MPNGTTDNVYPALWRALAGAGGIGIGVGGIAGLMQMLRDARVAQRYSQGSDTPDDERRPPHTYNVPMPLAVPVGVVNTPAERGMVDLARKTAAAFEKRAEGERGLFGLPFISESSVPTMFRSWLRPSDRRIEGLPLGLTIAGVPIAAVGGLALMSQLAKSRRKSREKEMLDDAKQTYYAALMGGTEKTAAIDELGDTVLCANEKQASSSYIRDALGNSLNAYVGALVAAGLLGAGYGTYSGYQDEASRSEAAELARAMRERAKQRWDRNPGAFYAYPVMAQSPEDARQVNALSNPISNVAQLEGPFREA